MTPDAIQQAVQQSLQEDIGTGDITAQLIPADLMVNAQIITRESMILCGVAWANEVFRQIDSTIQINWHAQDGDALTAHAVLVNLTGSARSLLTAERTALNWLQTLSGTATTTAHYVAKLAGTKTKILDTRKTIPNLRLAQKYAVRCGGGTNHRLGLFDAYLIKENHIASAGSITEAVRVARAQNPSVLLEVEVETLAQFQEACAARVDRIMLDNFSLRQMHEAMQLNHAKIPIEISGGINEENIAEITAIGVDYISVGALTKSLRAIDLSMRIIEPPEG